MTILQDKLAAGDAPDTEVVEICPLCESQDGRLLFLNVDRLHHLPGLFGVVRCEGCGLARLSPRPTKENLGFYYPEDYYSFQPHDELDGSSTRKFIGGVRDKIRNSVLESLGYQVPQLSLFQRLFQPLFRRLFKNQTTFGWGDRLPRFVKGGRALEVGCGSGYMLSVLKRLGWDVAGIEMSEKAARAAKELYDIDVFCGEIANAPFEKGSFDYVHLRHVIEHLTDPVIELKNIAALLKPGGIIYIEAPNIDSFCQHKSGRHWLHWDSPRHLYGFNPATLTETVRRSGLRITTLRTELENLWGWAELYRTEEANGEKLADRFGFLNERRSHYLSRRWETRVRFWLNRDLGDTLCCWAVKQ